MEAETRRKRLLHLLIRFINAETRAPRFVDGFFRLWRENRDSQSEIKKTWDEPFDEQLQAAFLRKEISKEEFTSRWNRLWGVRSESELAFLEMIDQIFSACDRFQERPDAEYELNENQLRAFAAESLASYLQVVAKQGEIGVR